MNYVFCFTGTGSSNVLNQVTVPIIAQILLALLLYIHHVCCVFCFTGTGSSNVLNQVTVPIIAQSSCGSSSYYGNEFDPSTMICAGYPQGGKDSCQVTARIQLCGLKINCCFIIDSIQYRRYLGFLSLMIGTCQRPPSIRRENSVLNYMKVIVKIIS